MMAQKTWFGTRKWFDTRMCHLGMRTVKLSLRGSRLLKTYPVRATSIKLTHSLGKTQSDENQTEKSDMLQAYVCNVSVCVIYAFLVLYIIYR